MVRKVPAAMWLATAVVSGVLPFLMGWLQSYGLSWTAWEYIVLGSLSAAAISILGWSVFARRADVSWLTIGKVAAVWMLSLAGAKFVGTWLYLALWNPASPLPFMTHGYAAQQGLVGLAIWAVALLILLLTFRRGAGAGLDD